MPGSHSSPSLDRFSESSRPIDVATRETTAFLASHLKPRSVVLEVGCGDGDVSLALRALGHRAFAIDSDSEAVARAEARGVAVQRASWPHYEADGIDALAFTRSLHHIGDLAAAIEAARGSLALQGVLLVEDFDFASANLETIGAFTAMLRASASRLLIETVEGELITDLLEDRDPKEVWRQRHARPDLHSFGAMLEVVRENFVEVEWTPAPYLYRYLVRVLPTSSIAVALVEDALRWERALGEGSWIGRRIVAHSRPR